MIGLDRTKQKQAGSSAMGGPVEENQARAILVLWKSGTFDTCDIADLLDLGEDQVCRTLHAARDIARGVA